jgi:hypothetical protein
MSPTIATAVFDVMGFATLAGRPLIGLLLDRVFATYVAVAFFLAPLIGFPCWRWARGAVAGNWRGLLGLALGAEIDLIAFLTTHYLGQGHSARSRAISSWFR